MSDIGLEVLGWVDGPLYLSEGRELVNSRPCVLIRSTHYSEDFPDLVLFRITIKESSLSDDFSEDAAC